MSIRGGKISINDKTLLCLVFSIFTILLLGSVSAEDFNNVDMKNLNLIQEAPTKENSLQNLEVSSNDSISETNSYEDNKTLQSTNIVTENITLYKSNGTRLVTTLFDSNNNPIVGVNITFLINGMSYNKTTNTNGSASIAINLAPGVYNATTIFVGSDVYENSTVKSTITVFPTIFGENITKYFKNGTQYYATFLNGTGGPLVGADVSFNINGVFYPRVTDENGTAKLNINLRPGTYILTAISPNGEMLSNTVTVLSTINAINVTKYFKNGTQYYATFLNGTGGPLVGADVSFNINGVFYPRVTDENGTAKLNINLRPDTYIITAISPDGEMVSNIVNVLTTIIANNISKYYMDSSTFNVVILNGSGEPLPNANVQFNIDGTIKNTTTDMSGVASLDIYNLPGSYIVTTTTYNQETTSNVVFVFESKTKLEGSNIQGFFNESITYSVNLVNIKQEPIVNQTINFNVNNKKYSAITNKQGEANITIDSLDIGEHLITYEYTGYLGFSSSNGSSIIKIINSTTILNSEDLYMVYGDKAAFNVTAYDLNNTPLVNKTIEMTVNGVQYNKTTNEKGIASLNITLNAGTYTVYYSYSHIGEEDYNHGSNQIFVFKQEVYMKANDLIFNYGDSVKFAVYVYNEKEEPIQNSGVTFNVNGVSYKCGTNGTAGWYTLDINLPIGVYNITYTMANDSSYVSEINSNEIVVNGYIISGQDMIVSPGTTNYFEILLTNEHKEPIANKNIEFVIGNDKITNNTNENGIAKVLFSNLSAKENIIAYYFTADDGKVYSGQNIVYVRNGVKINSIIIEANNLKKYIENNYALPESITIDGDVFTIPQFLYILSQATISISQNSFDDISVIDVGNPINSSKTTVSGNLYDYVKLAQAIVDYMETNGNAPTSMDTSLGKCGYEPLVYAFARVVAFYGNNKVLPAYVALKQFDPNVPSSSLDSINTITDLAPYLEPTKNCQVNNELIQKKAEELTKGLTNDLDKAKAIYNFVRDKISYSFYYDTKYGAVGTLNKGSANCCDQAQLLVALYRAAGLPARFAHGKCTFTSGSTYGHVWTQVLIGDMWVVGDPTSTRNSFGVVNNWNNYKYTFYGFYRELSF